MNRILLTLTTLLLTPLFPLHAAEALQDSTRGTLTLALQPFVDNQIISGAVALVADKEKVLDVMTVGFASLSTKTPMREDTLFWLASITKSFTATVLMTLVDDGKVNVDEQQSLAAEYGVRAIPTLLIFNKGQVADQIVGARSKRDFKASLDRVVV